MSEFREHSVLCMSPAGLHRMAYTEWGDAANPRVLVCVHGLTRVGRDFDDLARALAGHYRVICPDLVGRGNSDWLADPKYYAPPQYTADMVTLMARLNVESVHWVGTSLGGIVGMALAALPKTPVTRLVLNDVGPLLKAAALKRIAEYVGKAPRFETFEQAQAYIRAISISFGLKTEAQWKHLARIAVKPDAAGYKMHYDPAIAVPFSAPDALAQDVSLWPFYDAIKCPTLVVRGAQSDLLDHATLQEMTQRGPRAQAAEIPDVGHAPMFMDEDQIAIVRDFLLQ
ncbi:MAG: alpha/beta hydrolase [Betaproteobacteria bacterium]|nr:alpha/beta hydrolase [Betaproteobacteria bacterium]